MHDIRPYLPELFSEPGRLLYIGARPYACAWLSELAEAGHQITLLEIWQENAWAMQNDPRLRLVVQGDVRTIGIFDGQWEYVVWWHGPEHIDKSEYEQVLANLEAATARTLALASPWGVYAQGPHAGNPHEEHRWPVYPEHFMRLGYQVTTDGQADQPGSEIVAWKRFTQPRISRRGQWREA